MLDRFGCLRSGFGSLRSFRQLLLPSLRDTVKRRISLGINRLQRHPAYFPVGVVVAVELLPVFDTLKTRITIRQTWHNESMIWKVIRTSRSSWFRPRLSCVMCSLKQPVPNALAPSLPALNIQPQNETVSRTRYKRGTRNNITHSM